MAKLQQKKVKARETGVGKLTLLVFGTLIAVVLYSGYHVLPFYYYFFELQNQMESLVRVAGVHTDQQLRDKLQQQLKRMEISADIKDLKMERERDRMIMSLEYQESFDVPFLGRDYHIHTFKFHAYINEEIGL